MMKAFLICLVSCVFSLTLNAQNTSANIVKRRVVQVQTIASITETEFHRSLFDRIPSPVIRIPGCQLEDRIRYSVYTWSVNITAGIYPGVQTIDDNVPCIRGAGPSGTAYYIDGVRVDNFDLICYFIKK